MTTSKLFIGTAIAVITLGLTVLFISFAPRAEVVVGGAADGTAANQRLATTTTVGPSAGRITIFNANSACKNRVVGTKTTPIVLIFGDPSNGNLASTTLEGTTGFIQGASTTVAYDAELYGCGRWTAYASASTTITVSEYQ